MLRGAWCMLRDSFTACCTVAMLQVAHRMCCSFTRSEIAANPKREPVNMPHSSMFASLAGPTVNEWEARQAPQSMGSLAGPTVVWLQQPVNATVQQCNRAIMQQCNSATVQQCNNATVQQCNKVRIERNRAEALTRIDACPKGSDAECERAHALWRGRGVRSCARARARGCAAGKPSPDLSDAQFA